MRVIYALYLKSGSDLYRHLQTDSHSNDDIIVYIGQSSQDGLRDRLNYHERTKKWEKYRILASFDESYNRSKVGECDIEERRLIRKHNPYYNERIIKEDTPGSLEFKKTPLDQSTEDDDNKIESYFED